MIARRGFALVSLIGAATSASAQTTADLLTQGIQAYRAFQTEAARPIFQRIVSPSYLSPVTPVQRVEALKYLGASYAILGNADSAKIFFTAALDFDPFTDLDPAEFSSVETGPFQLAKQSVFRIGISPIISAVVNPRNDTTAYRFKIVSTHSARMMVELVRQQGDTVKETLQPFGNSDGLREVRWDGFMRSTGSIADSSTYMLRVTAIDNLRAGAGAAPEVVTQVFRVEHSYDPLEDTLPALPATMLLADRIPTLAPWLDLAKGVLFGALAYGVPVVALNGQDIDWKLHGLIAGGVTIGSGFGSWFYRTRNRAIPANVAENERRQQERTRFNDGVRARNRDRIAQTVLIITPITGAR